MIPIAASRSTAENVEGLNAQCPMKTLRDLDYSVLQQCMHCGLCLPTCPTYDETKIERHSPRGRIALMRAIADGELEVTQTFGEEMYYCLGCLACTSACPAGVNYAELMETARADVEQAGVLATPSRSFIRTATLSVVFTRPRLLRAIGRLLWLWQSSGLQALARRAANAPAPGAKPVKNRKATVADVAAAELDGETATDTTGGGATPAQNQSNGNGSAAAAPPRAPRPGARPAGRPKKRKR
jgi:Fe-S oxidoreductase